jgi:hypothetical protein
MKHIAKELNRQWGVGVRHALYSEDGKWYHPLKSFPGALFDKTGYVVFGTRYEYENCPEVKIGPDPESVHVPEGISAMSRYVVKGLRRQLLKPSPHGAIQPLDYDPGAGHLNEIGTGE